MKHVVDYLIALACIIVIISAPLCAIWGYKNAALKQNKTADTVYVYKTVGNKAPVAASSVLTKWDISVPKVFERVDSVFITQYQEVPYYVHDTLYVPISTKYYEELNGRLRLWISGYQAFLDRWELDEKETYIRRSDKVSFRVGVGPALIYTPFHKTPIDAGVGVFGGLTITF